MEYAEAIIYDGQLNEGDELVIAKAFSELIVSKVFFAENIALANKYISTKQVSFAMEKRRLFFLCLEISNLWRKNLISLKEKNIELENKAILLESAGKRKRGAENHKAPGRIKSYILSSIVSRLPQSPYAI